MDIHLKADRIKAVRNDPFFNALQVKYAYAVTCHKAQGGQWANVYIDQGYMTDDMIAPLYGLDPVTYIVEVQQCAQNQNYYRIIAPYGRAFAEEIFHR